MRCGRPTAAQTPAPPKHERGKKKSKTSMYLDPRPSSGKYAGMFVGKKKSKDDGESVSPIWLGILVRLPGSRTCHNNKTTVQKTRRFMPSVGVDETSTLFPSPTRQKKQGQAQTNTATPLSPKKMHARTHICSHVSRTQPAAYPSRT